MELTTAFDAASSKQQQQQRQTQQQQQQQTRPTSSLDIFKLLRKRQWENERMRHKLAQSTLNQLAAERKLKYISTIRSNPYIDRTVIFNQFTSGIIQAASATILNPNMLDASHTLRTVASINATRNTMQQSLPPLPPRFNLNRNEMNLLNTAVQQAGNFRVSSANLANKFDIVIPPGVELPPIRRLIRQQEHDSVFERLNPKYVIKKKQHYLAKLKIKSDDGMSSQIDDTLIINKVNPLKVEINLKNHIPMYTSEDSDEEFEYLKRRYSDVQRRGKQTGRATKTKTRKSKDKSDDVLGGLAGLVGDDENDNIDDILAAEEKEKQLKLIDELEAGVVVEDIDITTDDWVNVNPTEIAKRYDMLRRYATAKINYLKNEYNKLESNDKEKIEKLKKQCIEHKKLWETERLVLLNVKDLEFTWDEERSDYLDKAEVAYQLQVQAQDAAERAIRQLEDFITEDAKLDRENAENTIQILRERSRTLTSISMAKLDDENAEARIDQEVQPEKGGGETRKSSHEMSEKIQVHVDTATHTLRFANKSALEKIVEYVNFDSSNKYTLVLSYAAAAAAAAGAKPHHQPAQHHQQAAHGRSRVDHQQQQQHHKSKSPPSNKKSSAGPASRKSSERKKSIRHADEVTGPNNEILDHVLSKVITEDEAMIAELRNANKSRSSLRSKHLAQLEENKANLNEIKSIAAQKLTSSNGAADQDLPSNEDQPLNRSHSGKREDWVKAASEAIINRVSSSKTRASSANNSNLLSHPVFLEYIKTYDSIIKFRNVIAKNLPGGGDESRGFLHKYYEKIVSVRLVDLDRDAALTPQVIAMTASTEILLTEVAVVFSQLIDELVAAKYEIVEKEQFSLAQRAMSAKHSSNDVKLKQIEEKEVQLGEKEKSLVKREETLNERARSIDAQKKTIEEKERQRSEIAEKDKSRLEAELSRLKEEYVNKEKRFRDEAETHLKEIENYKSEISQLNVAISSLKQDLNASMTQHDILSTQEQQQQRQQSPRSGASVLPPIAKKESPTRRSSSSSSQSIMFTRVDAVQNLKRLHVGLGRGVVSHGDIQNVKSLMDKYRSLQSKRFVELIKKYIHHTRIRETQELIKKNGKENVTSAKSVQSSLEKMKTLQEKKANKYMDLIKGLKDQRVNLAHDLNDTLCDLERKSGIFLVKPMYSYQGLPLNEQMLKMNKMTKSEGVRGHPLARIRDLTRLPSLPNQQSNHAIPIPANTQSMVFVPKFGNNWNIQDSVLSNFESSRKGVKSASDINLVMGETPRILELDINRMMISQNQIATNMMTKRDQQNALNSIRSYMTVNRPSGSMRRDVNQAYSNSTLNTPFASKAFGVEHEQKQQSPLPPINQMIKSKSFVSVMNLDDANDIAEFASLDSKSGSIATGKLSRANTDILPTD